MKYFSYYPGGEFKFHETASQAQNAIEEALDYERSEAHEGWSDNMEQYCWGEIKQRVIETMRRPRTDDDTFVSSDCDTIVDYGLVNT